MPTYSQNGECLVLTGITGVFAGRIPRVSVEIGVNQLSGVIQGNTRHLEKRGWKTYLIDGAIPQPDPIRHAWVTAENIEMVLRRLDIPRDFGVFSLDIDGMDYWVWREMVHKPAVVVIEYNAQIDPTKSLVTPYDPKFVWDGSSWFGASAKAIVDLAHYKDYKLICDVEHVNLVFVRTDLLRPFYGPFPEPDLASLGGRIVGPPRPDPQHREFIPPTPFGTFGEDSSP